MQDNNLSRALKLLDAGRLDEARIYLEEILGQLDKGIELFAPLPAGRAPPH
jgi:hypothetical protein